MDILSITSTDKPPIPALHLVQTGIVFSTTPSNNMFETSLLQRKWNKKCHIPPHYRTKSRTKFRCAGVCARRTTLLLAKNEVSRFLADFSQICINFLRTVSLSSTHLKSCNISEIFCINMRNNWWHFAKLASSHEVWRDCSLICKHQYKNMKNSQ